MPNNLDIVHEARQWLGTPYQHRHREQGRFSDCAGVVIGVARAFGVGDYRRIDYERNPDPVRMGRDLEANLDPAPEGELWVGEILWLKIRRDPCHLAIVGEHPEFPGIPSMIHAHSIVGQVAEHRLDSRWMRRIHRRYRYRDVDYEVATPWQS